LYKFSGLVQRERERKGKVYKVQEGKLTLVASVRGRLHHGSAPSCFGIGTCSAATEIWGRILGFLLRLLFGIEVFG
jgi:hypothetical protein